MLKPSLVELRHALDEEGFVIIRDAVPAEAIGACLRVLNLAIRENGLTPEEIGECQQATFFPHLRWEPEIWGVLPDDAAELLGWVEGDDWADPQLLLRFPDRDLDWPLEAHVDEPPPGAPNGYKGIVGIALSSASATDGAPHVWRRSHRGEAPSHPEPIELAAGDVLVMHPLLGHAGSLNLGHTVRYAVYFRLLRGPVPPRSHR
jgi:hypothetical protein